MVVVERGGGGVEKKCCCCCWRRVQVVLSSTLYPGVDLWEAEWRWPSLPGVDVLSLALDLWPCPPPPSWLSTSDVLPEELSCRGREEEGERVKHKRGI